MNYVSVTVKEIRGPIFFLCRHLNILTDQNIANQEQKILLKLSQLIQVVPIFIDKNIVQCTITITCMYNGYCIQVETYRFFIIFLY